MTQQTQQSQTQQTQQPQTQQQTQVDSSVQLIALIIIVAYGVIHAWAVIKSLLCFGKSGSTAEHTIGLLLAIFLGPIYFIYLYANKDYCNDVITPAIVGGKKRK